jgi:hypothetical protein
MNFVRRGGSKKRERKQKTSGNEKREAKNFPGIHFDRMLKTFSFTGMNKTLNNEQDEQE